MATLKRIAFSTTNDESANNANNHFNCIYIDHSNVENLRYPELSGKSLDDTQCNIKFLVEDTVIESHREVLNIFAKNRQLVRDLIERDRQSSHDSNESEANILQMSGTTAQAFRYLLDYVYTGIAECDHKCSIDLANTALKLNFKPLATAIAQQFATMSDICQFCEFRLTVENVDDVYHIARNTECRELSAKCGEMMDKNGGFITERFLQRNCDPSDDTNTLTYSLETQRYCNYIQFKLPDSCQICFNVKVSSDRKKWIKIVNNESILCNFWHWFYFREQRIKYIRITHTDDDEKNDSKLFNIRHLEDGYFLCKRVNMELRFDGKYLIPTHDAIKYPIPYTPYRFGDNYNRFTYCISDASPSDKKINYYYHMIGDKQSLEFYLPQTCLIDAIRFRLWYKDKRVNDFVVKYKNEESDEWRVIDEYKDQSSEKTIHFGRLLPVRWISITGTKCVANDDEFVVIHFECPPQKKLKSNTSVV